MRHVPSPVRSPLRLAAAGLAAALLAAVPVDTAPAADPTPRQTGESPRLKRTPVRKTAPAPSGGEASLEQRVAALEAQVAQLLEVIRLQGNDVTIEAGGKLVLDAGQSLEAQAGLDVELEAGRSFKVKAGNQIRQEAAGVFRVRAAQVDMP